MVRSQGDKKHVITEKMLCNKYLNLDIEYLYTQDNHFAFNILDSTDTTLSICLSDVICSCLYMLTAYTELHAFGKDANLDYEN